MPYPTALGGNVLHRLEVWSIMELALILGISFATGVILEAINKDLSR